MGEIVIVPGDLLSRKESSETFRFLPRFCADFRNDQLVNINTNKRKLNMLTEISNQV